MRVRVSAYLLMLLLKQNSIIHATRQQGLTSPAKHDAHQLHSQNRQDACKGHDAKSFQCLPCGSKYRCVKCNEIPSAGYCITSSVPAMTRELPAKTQAQACGHFAKRQGRLLEIQKKKNEGQTCVVFDCLLEHSLCQPFLSD